MTSELTVVPKADLAGDWEGSNPLAINAGDYTEPTLLGKATAGYQSGDSTAASDISEALTLPDIGAFGGGSIDFIAASTYDGNTTYSTTHTISYPGASILANDLIEIVVAAQESSPPSTAATASGFTLRKHVTGSDTFRPSITKLYKVASGGESGSVTVTLPSAIRCMMALRIWRGANPLGPYDISSGSVTSTDGTSGTMNPPAVTTATNGARVVTDFAFNTEGASVSPTAPSGYTRSHLTSGADRQLAVGHKEVATAGSEDPGAWGSTTGAVNYTLMTDALSPAAAVDLTALLITAVVDETTTAELAGGDAPVLSGATWDLVTSFEIPRTSTYRPMVHVWESNITSYVAGSTIDITVADHDGLHSWAAMLLIYQGLETSAPVQTIGSEGTGYSQQATFGTLTPATQGAKLLTVLAKTPSGWHYDTAPGFPIDTPQPSDPAGLTLQALIESDALILAAHMSPPLASGEAVSPGSSSWSNVEDWTTGLMTLRPDVAATSGSDIWSVLNGADESTYIEIAGVAGAMDEVVELDLSALPAGAIPVAARLEILHSSGVKNRLRAELVGINSDDSRVLGGEQQAGYAPASLTETDTISTAAWTELADGSALADYTRLGVRLFSTEAATGLTSHRVYSVAAVVEYVEGGPVVSGVVGPASDGDPVTWSFSSEGGLAQTGFEVMVIAGSGQDPLAATTPAEPLTVTTGEIWASSGKITGQLTRSYLFDTLPFARGAATVGVRAYSRLPDGTEVASDWATANFNLGSAISDPGQSGNTAALNAATGCVDVTVDTAAGATRAWLLRSTDGGAYEITKGSPYTVTGGAPDVVLVDQWAPLNASLLYKVAFDEGQNSETSIPAAIGGAVSTVPDSWYFISTDDQALNVRIDDVDTAIEAGTFRAVEQRRTVTATQPGNNVAVSSPSLGYRFSMSVRTITPAARAALEAILAAGRFRMVDILGREWIVRQEGDRSPEMMIVVPGAGDATVLRDAHIHALSLIEVA